MSYLTIAGLVMAAGAELLPKELLWLDDFLRLTFLVSPAEVRAESAVGVPLSLLLLMLEKVSCW